MAVSNCSFEKHLSYGKGEKIFTGEKQEMLQKINEAVGFLKSKMKLAPKVSLITGTGLGEVIGNMQMELRLSYEEIPHFPRATVAGHRGALALGHWNDTPAMVMEGRFHLYEGYSPQEVIFPVRVMAQLGVKTLVVASAAGGLNPLFQTGDIMMVTDHINLTGKNPLSGPNLDEFGPRFPDMSRVYDRDLASIAREEALKSGLLLREGVYVGILGPSLETPAETRFLRMIGADAVGMSTVHEVIAAVHCGLRTMVFVAITNVNLPERMPTTTLEEVIANAHKAGPKLSLLLPKILSRM
jgi:purine-nucleoside phosphorylase